MIKDDDARVRRASRGDLGLRRAALIVNTRSRSGKRAFFQAFDLLNASGVTTVGATCALHDPARFPEAVERALAQGHDLIILGGGDGSVRSVADLLAYRHAVLGLLPLGTANDFARTLGIPCDLEWACRTIACGKVVNVDLGLAGKKHYANLASVGLGVEVTQALSPLLKRTAGALAYPVAAVKAFFRHRPFSAKLTFPAGDYPPVTFDRLLHVGVGNGRFYGGGRIVAPGAGIDDKFLDVCAIELGRHRDLAGAARYLGSGEFTGSECVHYYRTSEVRIETAPRLPINMDGELLAQTPEAFSVAPDALQILVPKTPNPADYDAVD